MEISYLGHSSFRIRGKNVSVVTDPYASDIGLKFPKHLSADIVTVSHNHSDHSQVSQLDGAPFVVSGPGEYEIKGVGVVGLPVYHDGVHGAERGKNIIFRIELEGVSLVHLGDLGHPLTTHDIESINGADVLFIPVGGFYTIDGVQAAHLVHEIDPYIVVPMHYGRPELDAKMFGSLQPVSEFLKVMGKPDIAPQSKLVVSKDKLPEELQVTVLE